jgi:hypothetical protein
MRGFFWGGGGARSPLRERGNAGGRFCGGSRFPLLAQRACKHFAEKPVARAREWGRFQPLDDNMNLRILSGPEVGGERPHARRDMKHSRS